ncbi:MAG: repeat-associated core domain protein, partial [Bacteroidetes bacterium]|nr:repeat-associated core domain protein [Bacteroidota bacterium]
MPKPTFLKKLFAAGYLILFMNYAQAGIISHSERIYTPSLASPVVIGNPEATQTTIFPVVPVGGSPFSDRAVMDKITFAVDHSNPNFLPAGAEIIVTLQLDKYNTAGTTIISTTYPQLTLEYQPFSTSLAYTDKSVLTFSGTYKYTFTIQTITVASVSVTTLPANLYLDGNVQVERYFDYASLANSSSGIPDHVAATAVNTDCDEDGIDDEAMITWDAGFPSTTIVAEEYQLEWTFVNDYDASVSGPYLPTTALRYNFRNNSTRVTTSNTSYAIALTFEHGYLLYRVRAVGRDLTDPTQSIYGLWSVAETGRVDSVAGTSVYPVTIEHEGNKNWQYSSTYAEEGKKKEVISYFDGSLRNRQSVTKVNSDKNTIVGETMYDYQGRPAVNVLPVPVPPVCDGTDKEPALKFYPKFNQNTASTPAEYSRTDFDVDAPDPCSNVANGLNTVSGAANYYSPSNPVQTDQQAFVPDATAKDGKGYPYTQVEYTPDNTGRIRQQGGVGFDYQLGKNHETKYYYGQPNQIQLDRMFGSEAGDAAHYKKNIVVDANGQVSISYLDQEGRTIATSLAGDAPRDADNNTILATIPSGEAAAQTLTVDLFAKDANGNSNVNVKNIAADAIVFNTQLTVDYQSDIVFNYTLDVTPYTEECLGEGICFDCVYDLDIKVIDDCGNAVPSTTDGIPPITKKVGYFYLNTDGSIVFQTVCDEESTVHEVQNFTLPQVPVGNYTVSKTLTLDHNARDFYVRSYLDSTINTCAKTLHDFTAAALALVDTTACNVSCDSCAHSLQTINGVYYANVDDARDAFVAAGNGTEIQFDVLLEDCGAACKTLTWCEATYQQLLLDVSPDGQYAQFETSAGVHAASFPLSVLNSGNTLPKSVSSGVPADWRHPVIVVGGVTYNTYLSEDGTRSVIHISSDGAGGFIPAVYHNDYYPTPANVYIKYDAAGDFFYTYPENLARVEDFITNWDQNWAKSLVQYHPEYCYYESCQAYSVKQTGDSQTTDELDELLNNTNTYAAAVAANLIVADYHTTDPTPFTATAMWKMAKFAVSTSATRDPFLFNAAYSGYSSSLSYDVRIYQTFGTNNYSMVDAAAATARCGTIYGTSPGTSTCLRFGSDVGSDPVENTRVRDLEWNLLKGFYLSQKRKIQQKRADDNAINSCKTYNGCIGNEDYSPVLSGMLGTTSGPGFYGSPYFDMQQPCSIYLKSLYLNKIKRFIGPDDIHSPAPDEADYQVYLQTGQCPLAMDLQTLLSGLAGRSQLDNTTSLITYGEFTNDMYVAVSGGTLPATFIPYEWHPTTSSTDLDATFYNTLTSADACSVHLSLGSSGIASWDDIISFTGLTYTSTSGSDYYFSVMAGVSSGGTITYRLLTGHTCVKITGCNFPPTCTPNDLARDLSSLMTALQINGSLTATTFDLNVITPINYRSYITTNIQAALHTAVTALYWNFTGSEYELYTSGSNKLIIKLTDFSPSSYNYTNLTPLIKGFNNIKSDYENYFTMDGIDATGLQLVALKGSVQYYNGTAYAGVSMGDCGTSDPLTCTGDPYELRRDLEGLLNESLVSQTASARIDFVSSPAYTNLIKSYFPAGLISTSTTETTTTTSGITTQTLTFDISTADASCNMVLYTKGPVTMPTFDQLISVTGLVATGTPDLDNNYYSFIAIGTFDTGSGTVTDTIFGTSCLPLQNCISCPSPVACVACSELSITFPEEICAGTPVTFTMNVEDCDGTPQVLWNYDDGTVSSSNTHTYAAAGTYTVSISTYNPNCDILTAQSTITVTDCEGGSRLFGGKRKNKTAAAIVKEPVYYNAAIAAKLKSGMLVKETALISYNNYVDKLLALDSINGWKPDDTAFVAPISYKIYYAHGYKYCSRAYSNFLLHYDQNTDNKAYLRDISKFVIASKAAANRSTETTCQKAYTQYTAALSKYNDNAAATGGKSTPAISATTFYSNTLCEHVKAYISYLGTYTAVEQPPMDIKTYFMTRRELPDAGPCADLYDQYVTAYTFFQNAQLSNPTCPGYETTSPFYTLSEFMAAGLCDTPEDIILFNNYIQSFHNPDHCPGVMPTAHGGTMTEEACESLYEDYLQAIKDYNSSPYAHVHTYSMSEGTYSSYYAFIRAGLCNCVEAYTTYLDTFAALDSTSTTPPPVDIDHFADCIIVIASDPCTDAYNDYLNSIADYNDFAKDHPDLDLPSIEDVYSQETFLAEGYCNCVGGYVAFLNTIIDGTADLSSEHRDELYAQMDIANTCPIITPPCQGQSPASVFQLPHPAYTNPCVEQQINLAIANAQNAYNQYVDSMTTFISNAYTQHCMGALESFTQTYDDKEYHFTLYYYDQAGNLVKTIPPEGFHPLDTMLEAQIRTDRTNGTHTVFTNHTMPTTYEYNSLNQLVKQLMPDHDTMNVWEYTLPNGLDSRLQVTGTQFVTASKGYLSGSISFITPTAFKRGYVYTTDDGGTTWTKMDDIVASDLKKVQMIDATKGFAVGSNGIVVKTIDGGTTWDMKQLYNGGVVQINDLYFTSTTEGILVGNNNIVLKTTDGGLTYANIGGALSTPVLNYSSVTYDGTYLYVTGNTTSNSEGQIFKGTISGGFSIAWTPQLNITSPDLAKVRMIGTSGNGYAIGIDGTLLYTANNGANWGTVPTGTSNAFRDLYFLTTTRGVAIIADASGLGQIWSTTTGGASWSLLSNATDSYNAFNFYASDKGYALGNSGKMKRVVFGAGIAIGLVNIPTSPAVQTMDLSTAYFSDGNNGWVAGNSSRLYYTTNGMASYPAWVEVTTTLTAVKDLYFGIIGSTLYNTGLVLTTSGSLYKITSSPTSGTNYTLTLISASGDNYVDIDATASTVYGYEKTAPAVTSVATLNIATTAMAAVTISGTGPTAAKVNSIYAGATGGTDELFSAGTGGELFRADLSGTVVWHNQTKVTAPLPLNDIQAAGAGTVYAVGNDGSMLQSTDAGVNWNTMVTGTATQLNAIKFNTANDASTAGTVGLIAGNDGKLWKQTISTGTVTLSAITLPRSENMYDIALNTSNKAYVAGANGTVLYIPDITSPAATLASPAPGRDFTGIAFKTAGGVLAVGDHAAVFNYNTTSGGKVRSVYTTGLNDVNFINPQNGYTVGESDVIRHTADGGLTWQYVAPKLTTGGSPASIPQLNRVLTINTDSALVGGQSGYSAYVAGLQGTAVATVATVLGGANVLAIQLRGEKAYISGASATVLKSNDHARSFGTSLTSIPGGGNIRAIHIFQNANTFMAVGNGNKIYCYNGSGWVQHAAPGSVSSTEIYADVFFHDDRNGYVVGNNGVVLKCNFQQDVAAITTATTGMWSIEPLTGINGTTSTLAPLTTVTTIDFPTRYRGFIGGGVTSTGANYARLVEDETNIMSTRFWYDRLGRMVVSQNSKQYKRKLLSSQLGLSDYSYTTYDALGRISEAGEKTENSGMGDPVFSSIFGDYVNSYYNPNVIRDSNLTVWRDAGARREVTHTYYDEVIPGSSFSFAQDNLRKRVASVTYEDADDADPLTYQHATHYSYDIHG